MGTTKLEVKEVKRDMKKRSKVIRRQKMRLLSSDCRTMALAAEVSARRTAQLSKFTTKIFFITLALAGSLQMTSSAIFPTELAQAFVERKPEPVRMTLETAIREIPKEYGIEPAIVWAINQHESMQNKDPHHFDPGKLEEARKYTDSDYEAKMLASSHGPMHVHALTARGYGVHWSQLSDPETSVRLACRKLKECKAQFAKQWNWIACYNGSGPRAQNYPKFIYAWLNKPEAKQWIQS